MAGIHFQRCSQPGNSKLFLAQGICQESQFIAHFDVIWLLYGFDIQFGKTAPLFSQGLVNLHVFFYQLGFTQFAVDFNQLVPTAVVTGVKVDGKLQRLAGFVKLIGFQL